MPLSLDERRYRSDLRILGARRVLTSVRQELEAGLRNFPGHGEYHRLSALAYSRAGANELAWLQFLHALDCSGADPVLLAHIVEHAERAGVQDLLREALAAIPGGTFTGPIWDERQRRLTAVRAAGSGFAAASAVFNPTVRPHLRRSFNERLPVQALSGWGFLDTVETLWVIGAHRFDEKVHFDHLLPHLKQIILFEPHPDTFAECQKYHRNDPRVRVLQVAVSDRTGMMDFNVSSNDGLSSSLLSFGEHTKFAPTTRMVGQTRVRTMTWQAARRHFGLPCPQFLVIDAQGAEHSILSGIPTADQRRIGLIYAEASTRPIYAGAKTLDQVDRLLARNFSRAGFFPIHSFGGVHGNAIFVNRGFLNLRAGSSPRSRPCVATPRAPTAIPGTAETVASQIRGRLQRILFGSLRDTMQATRGNADGRGILYLWGAGGYGRQILSILRRLGFSPCAFVDRDESKWGQSIDGLPVVSPAHLWTEFEKSQPASASRPYIVISTTIRSALLADLASHGLTVSADFHVPAI